MTNPYMYNIQDLATRLAYNVCKVGGYQFFFFGYVWSMHIFHLSSSYLLILSHFLSFSSLFFVIGLLQIRELEITQSTSLKFVRLREVSKEVKEGKGKSSE